MTRNEIWLWLHNLWSPSRDQILWDVLSVEERHEYLSLANERISIANLLAIIMWDQDKIPGPCDWENSHGRPCPLRPRANLVDLVRNRL